MYLYIFIYNFFTIETTKERGGESLIGGKERRWGGQRYQRPFQIPKVTNLHTTFSPRSLDPSFNGHWKSYQKRDVSEG